MGPRGRSILLTCILVFSSCTDAGQMDDSEGRIRMVMSEQESAWDAGDLHRFMEGYHERVCFISSRGTKCGREEVTAQYLRSYPNKASMGDLQFDLGEILITGPEHAWCTGKWTLFRTEDTLSGGFSLLWVRTPEGWRILRDHTY